MTEGFHYIQKKQTSRGVLIRECSENMQQIYRKTPMSKCNFNKVTVKHTFTCLHRKIFKVWLATTLLKSQFGMSVLL